MGLKTFCLFAVAGLAALACSKTGQGTNTTDPASTAGPPLPPATDGDDLDPLGPGLEPPASGMTATQPTAGTSPPTTGVMMQPDSQADAAPSDTGEAAPAPMPGMMSGPSLEPPADADSMEEPDPARESMEDAGVPELDSGTG